MVDDGTEGRDVPSPALAAAATALRALELIPHAACSVDRTRRVLDQNARAAALFARQDAVWLLSGRLHCGDGEVLAALDGYLRNGPGEDPPPVYRLGPRRGARSALIRVEPNPLACSRCGPPDTFLVHVFEPTHDWTISTELLQRVYGLTRGQARVVHFVLRGRRPAAIALELGITEDTVRTHLKHAMRKLEVDSQAQLIQVLASGPWR